LASQLVEVMELCWHRNVELRPKLRQLSECIQTVFQASQGNLIDQMRRMNEKHALNLENLVAQRTEALAMARSDTEKLLHEMLPKYRDVVNPFEFSKKNQFFPIFY
jgi:hypothetical protein